jgi:hypothetical protein
MYVNMFLYRGDDFMNFFAFFFLAYGALCLIFAAAQLRYYYKNKIDKKFIDFKKYTKSMISLFLITSVLSILLGLTIILGKLSITITNMYFMLILVIYIFSLNYINKNYGLIKKQHKNL